MEKYKRQEVSPVEQENERDETYQASNPQIDSTRTHFNYNIIYPMKSYMEIINGRLSELELKRKIRSDAILMNSFIVIATLHFGQVRRNTAFSLLYPAILSRCVDIQPSFLPNYL